MLSRLFLVPMLTKAIPALQPNKHFSAFFPAATLHLDDALEQHPAQHLPSFQFLVKMLHSNCRNLHSRLISLYFILPSTTPPCPLLLLHWTCLLLASWSFTCEVFEAVKVGAFQRAVAFLLSPRQQRSGSSFAQTGG